METSKEAITNIDEGLQSFTGKAKDLFGQFKGKLEVLSNQARSKIAGTANTVTTGGSKKQRRRKSLKRSVKSKKTRGRGKKTKGRGKKTRGKK